jgi:serine/threonine protein kinase
MSSFASDLEGRSDLLSRLRADQSQRWSRGERVLVESYLQEHPELSCDPETLLALVFAEVMLRLESGEAPTLAEYLARFPQQGDKLRQRWAAHKLIAEPELAAHTQSTGASLPTDPLTMRRPAYPLPALAGYEVLQELGKGGMGVVFKARQVAFDRLVAVKMIRSLALAGPAEMARFRTEALAVGRLDHPHVVRVFAFGEEGDCPFLAMEHLPGGTLSQLLRRGLLPVRRAAELVRQVALGVQAAHQAGILHRDLKPGNVLLDSAGNAHVADFGLAKLLDRDSRQTASEALLGTPAYMAPEQAAGKVHEIGPAADVWALGVILYECLTGQLPFHGTTRQETLQLIQTTAPVPPARCRAETPLELDAVCLKCLAKAPAQRYVSAAALAEDLHRWLQGRATVVRPTTFLGKSWRVVRTHRWLALAAGPLLLAFLLLQPERKSRAFQSPRQEAETTLAAGKPYELPAEAELPGPFRWVIGDAVPLHSDPVESCFTFQTLVTNLLELLANPQRQRYLFSAEVRHDDAAGNSQLGLYFGYREHTTAEGVRQSGFFTLSFADRGLLARGPTSKGKTSSAVALRWQLHEQRNGMDHWVAGKFVGRPRLFQAMPRGQKQSRWRRIAVKVTPEGIEAFWDEGRGKLESFTTVPTGELERVIRSLKRNQPGMNGLPDSFQPRSGLGLFIYRGQPSFRRIRVEPLQEQ